MNKDDSREGRSSEQTHGARPKPASGGVSLAILAFGALSLVGAWLILISGGFESSPKRRPDLAVTVGGAQALVMAAIQLMGSAVAFTWFLQRKLGTARAAAASVGLTLVPAIAYVLAVN